MTKQPLGLRLGYFNVFEWLFSEKMESEEGAGWSPCSECVMFTPGAKDSCCPARHKKNGKGTVEPTRQEWRDDFKSQPGHGSQLVPHKPRPGKLKISALPDGTTIIAIFKSHLYDIT